MSSSKSPDIVEMLTDSLQRAVDNNELRETFIEAIEHMSKTKTALSEETQRSFLVSSIERKLHRRTRWRRNKRQLLLPRVT